MDDYEEATEVYVQALAVVDPIRLRFWDSRGLTMSQLRLMYLIWQAEGCSVSELAEQMRVRPPTLSGLLDRLGGQALIARTHDLEDRRVVRVSLTQEGRRLLDEITTAGRAYLKAIFDGMGPEGVSEFVRALNHFSQVAATTIEPKFYRVT